MKGMQRHKREIGENFSSVNYQMFLHQITVVRYDSLNGTVFVWWFYLPGWKYIDILLYQTVFLLTVFWNISYSVLNFIFYFFNHVVYLKFADKVTVLTSIKALKTDLTLYIPETTKQFVIDKLKASSRLLAVLDPHSFRCGSRHMSDLDLITNNCKKSIVFDQKFKYIFCILFWRASVCRPLLCLLHPFCNFDGCLDWNPESYSGKQSR